MQRSLFYGVFKVWHSNMVISVFVRKCYSSGELMQGHAFETWAVLDVFGQSRCKVAAGANLVQGLRDDGPPVLEDLVTGALLAGQERAVL